MGAGIAHAFLVSGWAVDVREVSADAVARGRAAVERSVAVASGKGTLAEPADVVLARLRADEGLENLGEPDLVVEAVPEDLAVKTDTWARVAAGVPASTVLASNTSSLSIDRLAREVGAPERFCGLHFFNPVPVSELVEVVRGSETASATVETAVGWVRDIGKAPIVVGDAPGFASSRLGVAIGLEAIRMLEENVASAEDIDRAMTLGYKFPVGPLRLTDLVGLDVRLGIAEYLHATLGDRFAPPRLLREKVAAGELGRKSGRGFFDW
jgi:3-hydroxybutyryl-CoA dehydrogenase